MRARTPPFPVAPQESVHFAVPWQVNGPIGPVPLTDEVAAWDYFAELTLSAVLEVDADAVRDACHLGDKSELSVVVTAASNATKMRGPVTIVPVASGSVTLNVRMLGHELGGRLTLDTLVVASTVEGTDELSPRARGSILWSNRRTTWLEGESPRFPTEVADLGDAPFFTPGALWYLDLRMDDLDASALGAVRLILNEKHPAIQRVLAGDTSPAANATLSALRWDVARQLVSAALESDEFLERGGVFEEDSLGSMLATVLALYWPGESPRALRQLRLTDPYRLERELQDRAGLFRD